MDLFSQNIKAADTPLAERLRPTEIENILGQDKALKEGTLNSFIEKDRVPSLILWGPPGCGKTTFARALARKTAKQFISLNAISTGSKQMRELSEEAKKQRLIYQKGTVIFIDEIHRLNKSQQDILLPYVESGDITLLGATTENPSFEVNSALLSRCRVVVFEALNPQALGELAERAMAHLEMESQRIFQEETLSRILLLSGGDGRRLLNLLEQIAHYYKEEKNSSYSFPLQVGDLETLLSQMNLYYDKSGEDHYDTVSAFIKCLRGSDPDAGLYYLARMIESGEDPKFIARRLIILASEDIGNADPRALGIALNGMEAVEKVGLPEAAINLAQVVTYLASAPKSNRSYVGLKKAQEEVRCSGKLKIPMSVRNAPTKLMKNLGYGKDYNYAHEGATGWLPQQFLPDEIKNKKFYEPSGRGFEKKIQEYMDWVKQKDS